MPTEEIQKPYIETERTVIDRKYNPKYGDHRICKCDHPYHRHFDSYDNMEPVGCKYCVCDTFVEQAVKPGPNLLHLLENSDPI